MLAFQELCIFYVYCLLWSTDVHCILLLKFLTFVFCRKIENEQKKKKLVDKQENKERKRSMRKGRQRYETNPYPNSNKHRKIADHKPEFNGPKVSLLMLISG